MGLAEQLVNASKTLADEVNRLRFSPPVTHVYNPLDYAFAPHKAYLRAYANAPKKVIFLGMNPGPFGMVQCGVPFGEIDFVRNWLMINAPVVKPAVENPKRPIEGFACARSEVSGRRLWGLFRERFSEPEHFFAEHFVANYCPLAFFDEGRNLTPDKLPAQESAPLYAACDQHLRDAVTILGATCVIGIGAFAEARAKVALKGIDIKIDRILHPSPASPAANRGFAAQATQQLIEAGIWT